MPNKVEHLFYADGLKCVVVLTQMGHRCGYVGVPPNHPLYGLHHNDTINSKELLEQAKETKVNDNNFMQAFLWNGEDANLSLLISVHGGITYSALSHHTTYPTDQFDPLWYFGFACNHYRDAPDIMALLKFLPTKAKLRQCLHTDGIIRTANDVYFECCELASQLQVIAKKINQKDQVK